MNYIENSTNDSKSQNSINALDNTLESNRILQMIMQKKYVVENNKVVDNT